MTTTLAPRPADSTVVHDDRRLLIGCLLAVALFRLSMVWLPLGIDEGGFAYVGTHMLTAHDHGAGIYGNLFLDRPPLLVVVYGLAAALAGSVGVRLLGLAAALALVTAVARIAGTVGGPAVRRYAIPLISLLVCLPAIRADMTYSELLGAAPAAWSVALLLEIGPISATRRGVVWAALAGVLAACAALFKQSIADGIFVAGVVLLTLALTTRTNQMARMAAACALGAVAPIAAAVTWAALEAHGGSNALYEAVVRFRVQALHALQHDHVNWLTQIGRLLPSGAGAGMLVLVPLAVVGIVKLRSPLYIRTGLATWLAVSFLAMLGGGFYWRHYWIGAIAPVTVLASCALASVSFRARLVAFVLVVVCVAGGVVAMANSGTLVRRFHDEHALAQYVHANERPDDSAYVLYARANLIWYLGLPSPYRYQWIEMNRAQPDAPERVRAMLRSEDRPTWIVQWHRVHSFGLDRSGSVRRALVDSYRHVATVCHHWVWLRRGDTRTLRRSTSPKHCA